MDVVQADGQYVEPVTVDELRFAVAETYDVLVRPTTDTAFTIAAEAIDRTGFFAYMGTPGAPQRDARPRTGSPVACIADHGRMTWGTVKFKTMQIPVKLP